MASDDPNRERLIKKIDELLTARDRPEVFPTQDWALETAGDPDCKHYILEPFIRIDAPGKKRIGWTCKMCGLTIVRAVNV